MKNKRVISKYSNEEFNGFSKLNREERILFVQNWLGEEIKEELDLYLHSSPLIQDSFSAMSENYLTNFSLPLGLIPNVLINEKRYIVPAVIEESSVIAAASKASKFWSAHGGFKTELLGTTKKGQVHFTWSGSSLFLQIMFPELKKFIFESTHQITDEMSKRGGGIKEITLVDKTSDIPDYYQLDISFGTADAMGANFINSCLEFIADAMIQFFRKYSNEGELEVIMSILSNYTPDCVVKCSVECSVDELKSLSESMSPEDFARKFKLAVQIANVDISRAVTHNKGIFNGFDAVLLATGNDWRAVEASGHSFASKDGNYRSLSEVLVENEKFQYSITLPLAVGVVGGLTNSHPLVKFCLKLLGQPSATDLMQIITAIGMANNFSAITSLITAGIQKGHMRMHLSNILRQLNVNDADIQIVTDFYKDKPISFSEVAKFVETLHQ